MRILLLLLLPLAACSDGGGDPGPSGPAKSSDLTLDAAGGHADDEARRLVPRVTITRGHSDHECRVETDGPAPPEWIEVSLDGVRIQRWSNPGSARDWGCSLNLEGGRTLVVRVGYPGGEIWRRTIPL